MIDPLDIGIKVDNADKIAATANLPTNEKLTAAEFNAIPAKVNELITAVNILDKGELITYTFETPRNIFRDYFAAITIVTSIQAIGVASLALSTNGGQTYTPVALPLAAPLSLPIGWNFFRITYLPGIVGAGLNLTV